MRVVVVGNGAAGVAAALRIREHHPDWSITMVSGESEHHFSRPALMYIFMGHMRFSDTMPYSTKLWAQRRIELRRAWVERIDTHKRELQLVGGDVLPYDRLLLATGSQSNKFGWPGQDLEGVQGLYNLQDLQTLYANVQRAKNAVIVGGGLIGIELAEMLHARGVHVTLLVREKSYWSNVLPPEESAMVSRLIKAEGFSIRFGVQLTEIVGDDKGRACAVVTDTGERLPCEIVGLTAGVSPNLSALRGSDIATGRGILVDWSFKTSADGVYAAGDCAEFVTPEGERNVLEQVWYTAKKHGELVGDVISGHHRVYERGIWYNSAKFLDLEYQVYGRVNMRVEGERNLYWEHPDGYKSLRLVLTGDQLIGVNVMGIRYRQEVCHDWIRTQRSIGQVLESLEDAHFDPEFFRRYEPQMRVSFREQLKK